MSRYAATPLIVALSLGHTHITRFLPWSPIATGNHLDRGEKFPNFAQTSGTDTTDVIGPLSGISDPLGGEFPHYQIFVNDRPNQQKWDSQLLSY